MGEVFRSTVINIIFDPVAPQLWVCLPSDAGLWRLRFLGDAAGFACEDFLQLLLQLLLLLLLLLLLQRLLLRGTAPAASFSAGHSSGL